MAEQAGKTHMSVCIAGHVDSGKSTTTGRLIFELGGIDERKMEKLQKEADAVGKSSFAFAFYMDRQKEERARGVTIQYATDQFYTSNYHYTILDCPGHKDYVKNMLTGSSQADVAVLMIPADGFTTALAKGNPKKNEIEGQTRQHALLLNLLGVKQLIVCINKMDCDSAKYSKEKYDEVYNEAVNVLSKVGWKKDFLKNQVAFLPISGFKGDNLIKPSENMPWWTGVDLQVDGQTVHVHTLLDVLDKAVLPPKRPVDAVLRVPVSGLLAIPGIGDVVTGCVEQGTVKKGDEVVFLPRNTETNACGGKVFSIEMHHKQQDAGPAGNNVGMNIKGLPKDKKFKPKAGDVMILKSDKSLGICKSFTAAVQVMNHPNELKAGYCPIAFVRTGRSACKMTRINWRHRGKEGKLVNEAESGSNEDKAFSVQANDMAEVVFEPQQPFVVDTYQNCEGLGRVAIMDGNSVIMLGKVMKVEFK